LRLSGTARKLAISRRPRVNRRVRPLENAMKRTWTIIGVKDVPRSFRWYQSLFGQPARPPGHLYFGQLLDSDGTVLLCLHQWGVEDHPSLRSPEDGTPGNGLLLFFRVDDFDLALQRARALGARLAEEPHVNPNTRTKEFSLRDLDGYFVTISALSAQQRTRMSQGGAKKRLRPTKARGGTRKSQVGSPRLRG
jgi:catechol 2,3-dioxygenase-like lactoylglutathione lyase family enzyme